MNTALISNLILSYLCSYDVWLFIGVLMFCGTRLRKRGFALKFSFCMVWLILLSILDCMIIVNERFQFSQTLTLMEGYIIYSSLLVMTAVCLSMLFCFQIRFIEILFFIMAASCIQHCVSNIYILSFQLLHLEIAGTCSLLLYLCEYLICYVLFYLTCVQRLKHEPDILVNSKKMIILSIVILFFVYVLFSWVSEQYFVQAVSQIMCCLLLLAMQFNFFNEDKSKRKNELLQSFLYLEQKQHNLTKETIEIINRKCHDLKYQVTALRMVTGDEEREKYLREIEKATAIYGTRIQTGSDILDIILMEKSLLCEKYSIKREIVVDGKLLNFMEDSDISTLFGNALDNAIECLAHVNDLSKRYIELKVFEKDRFISVHIENYNDKPVSFDKYSLPITTKTDGGYHGYGVKSIRYIVEKHGGVLKMSNKDDRFCVDILFMKR